MFQKRVLPWRQLRPLSLQDLNSALKGALSGSLEALMLALMKSTAQYDAAELRSSMKVGTPPGRRLDAVSAASRLTRAGCFRAWGQTRRPSSRSCAPGAPKRCWKSRRSTEKVRLVLRPGRGLRLSAVLCSVFRKELDKDIAGDTSGDFAKLLLALVQTKRDEPSNVVDYEKIEQDARVSAAAPASSS